MPLQSVREIAWHRGCLVCTATGLRLLLVVAAALLLNACAVGRKYDYRMPLALPVKGDAQIGLLVTDRRPYILNKDKTPDFVGLQRGGFGNPFDVSTVSGRPMVEDMTHTLQGALEQRGFKVARLQGDGIDLPALGRQAGTKGLARVVLLRIQDWETDTAMSTRLIYDLHLLILDPEGKVVAQNTLQGSSAIGGGMPDTIGPQAQRAFETKMGQLFYPPAIQEALDKP